MKAAVCREFSQPLVIEDIAIADPARDEVLVKIRACAICHSDLTYVDGGWGGALPAVYGHEAAGVVEKVGEGVSHVQTGDHVVVTLVRFCGTCHYCRQGLQVACEARFALDETSPLTDGDGKALVHGLRTGAFAEKALVHVSQLVVIDRDVPMEAASLLACGVVTGLGAVTNTASMRPGAHAVVIGCGGVGLNSVQGAKLTGAASITAIDIRDDKLDFARSVGATHVINSLNVDAAEKLAAITGGRLADYVFVTVGAKSAFDQAFSLAGRAGTIVLVGMPENGVLSQFDPGSMAAASQRILGSKMGSTRIASDIPWLLEMYRQGRLELDRLISGRFTLDEINEALEGVRNGSALRNVVLFD